MLKNKILLEKVDIGYWEELGVLLLYSKTFEKLLNRKVISLFCISHNYKSTVDRNITIQSFGVYF